MGQIISFTLFEVYTSAKEEKNTALLYKYLIHRVCGMPFTTPAQVVDKDSIFVPAGWDNDKKLEIIKDTITDADHPLEVLIIHQSFVVFHFSFTDIYRQTKSKHSEFLH